MTAELQAWLSVGLMVLARVSAFVAVLPFFAVARVPATIRAYLAIALSLAMTPLLYNSLESSVSKLGQADLLAVLAGEVGIGLLLGFIVRVFFLAVSFVAELISQLIGFTGMSAPSIIEGELMGPLADLVLLYAAVLFFISDLHHVLIRGLVTSYEFIPVAKMPELSGAIELLSSRVSTVFVWSLQLSAPFLIYVTVCNFLLGLANRLVPQVPIQFVMAPAILLGGLGLALFVLTLAAGNLMARFTFGAFGI